MFLHKVFGYRGVVLFPWLARVYDRDLPGKSSANTREALLDPENNLGGMGTEIKGKEIKGKNAGNMVLVRGLTDNYVPGRTHTYYQVLIDGRDSPYITHRAQTESVTFLGNHSENTRYLNTFVMEWDGGH